MDLVGIASNQGFQFCPLLSLAHVSTSIRIIRMCGDRQYGLGLARTCASAWQAVAHATSTALHTLPGIKCKHFPPGNRWRGGLPMPP